jgi:hypothetical protein
MAIKKRWLAVLPLLVMLTAMHPSLPGEHRDSVREVNNPPKWQALFNGKDFSGWDMHLNKPHSSLNIPVLAKDSTGEYLQRLGINNDPLKVFTVVTQDGKPAIRVSGQVFGYIVSTDSFSNFRLKLQFKWGTEKWAPRQNEKRDAGVLYYSVGNVGEHHGTWMTSQECQIQEGDCGDFWPIGNTRIDIPAEEEGMLYRYNPSGSLVTFGNGTKAGPRCLKSPDNEKATGEWNTIEVVSFDGNSVHLVNGKVTMRLFNSRHLVNGVEQPLKAGRIQLQSEGAEIFYRQIEVLPLTKMPSVLKDFKHK